MARGNAGADEAVGALRRELRRLEATRSKHEALDLEERPFVRVSKISEIGK